MNVCSMTWILLSFIGNTHYIRQSRPDTVPGRPDELFFLPEKSGGENHLQYTTQQQLEEVGNSADLGPIDNDNDYQQYWPILYHMISFIQWESEEIIRWVINWNIQTSSLNLSKNCFNHCCKAQLIFVEIVLLLNCHLYLVDSLSYWGSFYWYQWSWDIYQVQL